MKKLSFIIIFALWGLGFAQPVSASNMNIDTVKLLQNYVASQYPGHDLLDYAFGDINNDEALDAVLIVERPCVEEENMTGYESTCRLVLFLTLLPDQTFEVLTSNGHLVECSDCGGAGVGDPYQNLEVRGTRITLTMLYGACEKSLYTIVFSYSKKHNQWLLTKEQRQSYSCLDVRANQGLTTTMLNTKAQFGIVYFENYFFEAN